jgi:hypothetical protein
VFWGEDEVLALTAGEEIGRRVRRGEPQPGAVEGDAQVVRRRVRVEIGPKRLGQLVAVEAVAGGEGEQLDDRSRASLPPSGVGDRPTVDLDAEAAQEADPGAPPWSSPLPPSIAGRTGPVCPGSVSPA